MNVTGSRTPDIEAVAVNRPATPLAIRSGDVATPAASAIAVACVAPPRKLAPAAPEPDAPFAPPPSEKLTLAPWSGLPFASRTSTSSGAVNRLPTVAVRAVRPTAASVGGLPARLSSENTTGCTTPAAAALAVKVPARALAAKSGEVATPASSVTSVACVPPPSKVAPAAAPLAPEPSEKVMFAARTGLPFASSSLTCNGWAKWVPTVADWPVAPAAASETATPLGVFVSENETEP